MPIVCDSISNFSLVNVVFFITMVNKIRQRKTEYKISAQGQCLEIFKTHSLFRQSF